MVLISRMLCLPTSTSLPALHLKASSSFISHPCEPLNRVSPVKFATQFDVVILYLSSRFRSLESCSIWCCHWRGCCCLLLTQPISNLALLSRFKQHISKVLLSIFDPEVKFHVIVIKLFFMIFVCTQKYPSSWNVTSRNVTLWSKAYKTKVKDWAQCCTIICSAWKYSL